MTLQECFAAMGGDYNDVLGRLRSERLVQKFVLKFLDDKSFDTLCLSLEEGNTEEAFRAAHTIKGMCQNLSFTDLAVSASEMTEALRAGDLEGGRAMLARVRQDYDKTALAIRAFKAGLPE